MPLKHTELVGDTKENIMIYLDNNATTKTDEEVVKAMLPYLTDNYGNPSSIYKIGRENKRVIESVRGTIAKTFNCLPEEIYFTSGGTESDNTAIRGIAYAYKNKGNHIITSKIEHPAVLDTLHKLEKEGFEVTYVGVDSEGIINLDELRSAIKPTTTLITVMYANNEIGVIEPIDEIGKIAKENGIIFHTDAVQAVGSIRIDVQNSNIDSLSVSAHKFHGPKGVGVLYVKKSVRFNKFIEGGHQERNKRAGTENVAGIVGLGKALELAYIDFDEKNAKIKALRDHFMTEILTKIPYTRLNGSIEHRLVGNCNISFKFIEGEGILLNLDNLGICASSGSACTSGSLDPSHVLLAIGLDHATAHGSVRISISKYNTLEEIDYVINALIEIVARLRSMSPLYEEFLEGENK